MSQSTRNLHRGFSHEVMAAINQVRDYDRIFRERNPANMKRVLETFGYWPEATHKALTAPTTPAVAELWAEPRAC